MIKSLTLNGSNKINETGFYNTGSTAALNDKALKLVRPIYPSPIQSIGTPNGGTVKVEVGIDEAGNVVSAEAISGPQFYYDVSERAARKSKFPPFLVCGKAKSYSGTIVYSFTPVRK